MHDGGGGIEGMEAGSGEGIPFPGILSRIVPPRLRGDRETSRRAHLIAYVGSMAAVCSLGLASLRFLVEGPDSTVGWLLGAATIGFAFSPAMLRWSDSPRWPGRSVPLLGLVILTAMASVEGGLASEAMFWVPFVPFVAVMTWGLAGVTAMTVASLVAVLGVVAASGLRTGASPGELVVGTELFRIFAVLGATVFSGGLALAYERNRLGIEKRLRHIATHHPLTGLPGRTMLDARLHDALARARRSGRSAGVLFLDLDRFKAVNDEYGHYVGDRLLQVVASRLREVTREEETPCHLSGDEFVVVVDNATDLGMQRLSERVVDAFGTPAHVDDCAIHISLSLGVVVAGERDDVRGVLDRADSAMYAAKRARASVRRNARRAVSSGSGSLRSLVAE